MSGPHVLEMLFWLGMLGLHAGLGALAVRAFYRRRMDALVEARVVAAMKGVEEWLAVRERESFEAGRLQGANEMAVKAMLAGLRSN